MSRFRQIFPELTDDEYDLLVEPLGTADAGLLASLTAGHHTPTVAPAARTEPAIQDWVNAAEQYPFQRVARHFASTSLTQLAELDAGLVAAGDARMMWDFLQRVEARIGKVAIRALVAGVNHARTIGRLRGDTPHARYTSFVDDCCKVGIEAASGLRLALLAPLIERVCDFEHAAFSELLDRLAADRGDIEAVFRIPAAASLVSYGIGSGDTHNRGRSVCILEFEGGRRLVYKPRDVSGEAAFGELLAALDARHGIGLPSMGVLRRNGYGYTEFVDTERDPLDRHEFFRQCGHLLAALFLVNARDMHHENVIATGRGPVAIDLETVLHPPRVYTGHLPIVPGNASDVMEQSVGSIGILPMILRGDRDSDFVDLGFLGGNAGGVMPFRALQFEQPFTDTMRLRFGSTPAPDRPPMFAGLEEEQVKSLGLEMAAAFEQLVDDVLRDREAFIELVADRFGGARLRYIHNPTVVYDRSLRLASSAQAIESAEYTVAVLKRMCLHSGDSDRRLVLSEVEQMARRDIPYFSVAADGIEIFDADGIPTGAHLDRSPLEHAATKLRELDAAAVTAQADMIRTAFVGRFQDDQFATRCRPRSGPAASTDEIAGLAAELADRLARDVLPDRFEHLPHTWIGPLVSAGADVPWTTGALGYDLYTGRMGPALALLAAGRALDDRHLSEIASSIFDRSAAILLDDAYEERTFCQIGVGAFTGLAGLGFALDSAGRITGNVDWRRAARVVVDEVELQVDGTAVEAIGPDVISGWSGVLIALRGAGGADELRRRLALDLARWVEAADPDAQGGVWNQAGLSHGVTGVLLALASAPTVLHDDPLLQAAATKLLDRLEHFYLPRPRRWRSNVADEFSITSGWCHGATGIAIALDEHERASGPDPWVGDRLDIAVDAIVADGFGRNLTWCHGDLGNLDALFRLAERRPELVAVADELTERWLTPANIRLGHSDPASRYTYAKSIMVGSAGIVTHLVNRLRPGYHLSPTRLAVTAGGDV